MVAEAALQFEGVVAGDGSEGERDGYVGENGAHAALGWRERRRTTLTELAAAYDQRHLLVCTVCAMPAVRADVADIADIAGRTHGALPGYRCEHCGAGELVDQADLAGPPPTLADRLAQLRARLRGARARDRLPGP